MEESIVSAPGKIILAGEHAVVYGQPAIVAAIDKRIILKAKQGLTKQIYIGLIKYVLDLLGQTNKVELKIKSELPTGSGLGSSAALATAMVWALLPKATLEKRNQLVKKIEDYQHGNSSGVDQTIVREGGFLRFQKGVFQPIKLLIKKAILIESGKPKESTGEMVKAVAAKFSIFNFQFSKIGQLVNNWTLGKIRENERLLEEIGVVGNKAKSMIRKIEAVGGVAKICGAGGIKRGSGMILAVHPKEKKLLQLIKQNHWRYLRVKLGGEGVRYEKN